MGVRMARTPGGGSKKAGQCVFGASGSRGMGGQFSGGKNRSNKLSWNDPPKKVDTTRLGPKKGAMPTQPNRYSKITHNPSGASVTPSVDVFDG